MSAVPHPPFPARDSQILKLIVNNAVGALRSGEVDAEGAILDAAVHAWYRATSKARTSVVGATSGVACPNRGKS